MIYRLVMSSPKIYIMERVTVTWLENPIFIKDCFSEKDVQILTESSTDRSLNKYHLFPYTEIANMTITHERAHTHRHIYTYAYKHPPRKRINS